MHVGDYHSGLGSMVDFVSFGYRSRSRCYAGAVATADWVGDCSEESGTVGAAGASDTEVLACRRPVGTVPVPRCNSVLVLSD